MSAGKPAAKVSASASAPSCAGGSIRWASVKQETRLTEVSPVVHVRKSDGMMTLPTVRVRNIVARFDVSDSGVSAHRVLAALADHLSVSELPAPGEESAGRERDRGQEDFLGHEGRYVDAEGVLLIDASFTVSCPGRDVYGSVTTWFGDSRDSLACGVDPGDAAWTREAYRLTCGRLKG